MNSAYELRLYDETLLTFSYEDAAFGTQTIQPLYVNEEKRQLLPLDLVADGDGIAKWLDRRIIPKNRAFVDEILKTMGLSRNDTRGIIDVCKGLSLNDSYWIVPAGFTGTFAAFNLYENRFSEILSLVAYTGYGGNDAAFSTSPEFTTNGMLPKAWRFIEGAGIFLYKGGTSGAANAGMEPYSEFYACQIAETMGLDATSYDLENWKGMLASKCKLFTDIDTAFVPIGRVVQTGGLAACFDYCNELGESFAETMRSMLVLDAVIYNDDRHFGNFGFLRDNKTGEIIAPAPLFDHGMSLFNFAMPSDIEDLDAYAKTRAPAYGGNASFESICREVMGTVQREQLRRLIGFEFQKHPTINWPDDRLKAIERHTQKRVRQLLELGARERKRPGKTGQER